MRISLNMFGGMAPKVAPHLLPEAAAQNATNCRFRSGALEPLRDKVLDSALTKAGVLLSLFRYWAASVWFCWTTDVNVVNSQIAGDPWARVYFTGDTLPRMTANDVAVTGGTDYPVAAYTLGLPAPLSAPSADPVAIPAYNPALTYAVGSLVNYDGEIYLNSVAVEVAEEWTAFKWSSIDPSTIESRAYIYTYVSAYGEEGPPANASAVIDVNPGQSVTVAGMSTAPAGSFNVTQKRIYRTNTGSNGTEYQLVATIPVAQVSYADSILGDSLGGVLVSQTWVAPPATLQGLISLPCGSLAGFTGNEVCFSVPYEHHAWPLDYRVSVDYPIIAIGAFGNYVLIATAGTPYVIVGQDPSSMSQPERIETGLSCVSKRGMVDMGDGLLYPTPDGLQLVAVGKFEIVTESILSNDDWQAMNPSSITAFLWNGKYVAFYNNGASGAFIFDPATKDFTNLGVTGITGGFTDLKTGKLYLVSGQNVYAWDGGGNLTLIWRSRPFYAERVVNLAAGQVFATAYPVTLKLYADGVLKHTATVANNQPFRLPSGYLALVWETELQCAAGRVNGVRLATSVRELQQD